MYSLRNFLITLLISLLVFIPIAIWGVNLAGDFKSSVLSGNEQKAAEQEKQPSGDEIKAPDNPTHPIDSNIKGESFNVLLIGTDYAPGMFGGYHPNVGSHYPEFNNSAKLIGHGGTLPEYPYRTVNADAIVLICVNKEKQTIAYLPIPSKMVLNVGGINTTLGELYYDKGLDYFINKVSGITGVPIDYYALTSFSLISDIVDSIGPVTYNVPCDMKYEDEETGYKISLSKGSQDINGRKAAQLLSYNSYDATSGLTREKVAMEFLQALAAKMTNITNINKADDVFNTIVKNVYTNITPEDLTANVELIFAYSRFSIVSLEFPGSYFYREDVQYFNPYINLAISKMNAYK